MKRQALFISALAVFIAFVFNYINISELKSDNKELRDGVSVITADDASYLSPGRNWINNGEIANSGKSLDRYFLRPPGYPLLYGCSILLSGRENAVFGLVVFQYILFGISIYCLYFLSYRLFKSKQSALFTPLIYGGTGIGFSFLNYTLTEGVSPQLLIIYFFLLISAFQNSGRYRIRLYLLATLLFSIIFIIRPVLGLFIIPLILLVYSSYKSELKKLFINGAVLVLIAFLPMLIWQVRNTKITGEYVGLHPIYYHGNVETIFRPPHKAMYAFFKGWAETGADYHSYTVPMWLAAMKKDSSDIYPKTILASIPIDVKNHFGETRLLAAFELYQRAMIAQQPFYAGEKELINGIPYELEAVKEFELLTTEFKQNFSFQYHVESPLIVFKELAFHSNLSLYIYQKTFRGNAAMETLRLITFCVHSGTFIFLFVSLFVFRKNKVLLIFILPCVIYIFYLCYFQRGIEERYSLPVLGFGVLILMNYLNLSILKILKKFR